MIDAELARRLAAAAFAEAERRSVPDISVVVTDPSGAMLLAMRADGQSSFGIDTARAKARSALGFACSSRRLAIVFGDQPAATAGIDAAIGGGFVPVAGAVVVTDAIGAVLGALSLSGGNPDADDALARVAVSKCGYLALD